METLRVPRTYLYLLCLAALLGQPHPASATSNRATAAFVVPINTFARVRRSQTKIHVPNYKQLECMGDNPQQSKNTPLNTGGASCCLPISVVDLSRPLVHANHEVALDLEGLHSVIKQALRGSAPVNLAVSVAGCSAADDGTAHWKRARDHQEEVLATIASYRIPDRQVYNFMHSRKHKTGTIISDITADPLTKTFFVSQDSSIPRHGSAYSTLKVDPETLEITTYAWKPPNE